MRFLGGIGKILKPIAKPLLGLGKTAAGFIPGVGGML